MATFHHILAPIDFSDTSERAIESAIDLAKVMGARLTLLHVWNIPDWGYTEGLSWPLADIEEAAKHDLDALQKKTAARVRDVDSMLVYGLDWERILETIESRKIDLVVMGTHGRRGLKRLLLGSVAAKIVRLSPVPVLTIGDPPAQKGAERHP